MDYVESIEFISNIVVVGLAVIWVSGIMYLVYYMSYDPIKLGNQKIWAKISIVIMLTINGFFIHKTVLPTVRHQLGASLFQGIAYERRSMLLMFGTISAVSWYVPLSLGAAAFLNFVVPASVILSMYAILLAIAVAVTRATAFSIWERWIPEGGGGAFVRARARLGAPERLQGA
jgi:hypothetical protein